MDILPSQRKRLAWTHSCATDQDRSVSPGLRAMRNVPLPFFNGQNAIPLPFALRQRDLYGLFQFAPLEGQIQSAAKAAKTAIDSRSRELRILGCEVVRVLVANLVEWQGCPIALANHVRAIGVMLHRARLESVLRLHERHKITLE